jgi:hypothetical protein
MTQLVPCKELPLPGRYLQPPAGASCSAWIHHVVGNWQLLFIYYCYAVPLGHHALKFNKLVMRHTDMLQAALVELLAKKAA